MHSTKHTQVLQEPFEPKLTQREARDLVCRLFGIEAVSSRDLGGYVDRNILVTDSQGKRFVLRIACGRDSTDTTSFELQNETLLALEKANLCLQRPVMSKHGRFIELEMLPSTGHHHVFRLLHFAPGTPMESPEVRINGELLYNIGVRVARMDNLFGLKFRPDALVKSFEWNIADLSQLREFSYAIPNEADRSLILQVVKAFEEEIEPQMDALPKSLVHSDLHFGNILVEENMPSTDPPSFHLTDIIDFGDLHSSIVIYELGVLCAYVMLCFNQAQWTNAVDEYSLPKFCIAGYLSQRALSDTELRLLPLITQIRCAQSLCIGAYSYYVLNPNKESLLDTQKRGWRVLRHLWTADQTELLNKWLSLVES